MNRTLMRMPDRRFLVLHGIENHRPPDHWQHWLTERLRSRGEQVLYPQLPDADDPAPPAWRDIVKAELGMLGDGERIVICHSLACALWLSMAAEESIAVDRVLFVSPPAADVLTQVAPAFADFPVRRDRVCRSTKSLHIAASDNDPYNLRGAQSTHGDPLEVDVQVVAGAGHITPADGFGPWPAVEAWCLNSGASLARSGG